MLCGSVAACRRCDMCTVRCIECDSTQRTVHIPHLWHAATLPHNIWRSFFLPNFNLNITLARLYWSLPDDGRRPKHVGANFDVFLTVHLSIFISVINQLDAQNFCFTISLFHASTCFEHMCSKHLEARNKLIVKQTFCASGWLITEINIRASQSDF